MTRIVVFGSLNADFVIDVAALPQPGETILGTNFRTVSGGKGGNQAHAAAKLAPPQVTVVMVARVGDDDAGNILREDLANAGADISQIQRINGYPSGTALITVDQLGTNTIVVSPGANKTWDDTAVIGVPLEPGDIFVVQLEVPTVAVRTAVEYARSRGARVILNAAPVDPTVINILSHVDVLIVNEIEAEQLLGLSNLSPEHISATRSVFAGDLVITRGGDGVTVASHTGVITNIPPHRVNAIDTVGAGDAFVGGLAVALAMELDICTAARHGNAAGALTATVSGARHPDLSPQQLHTLIGR